MTRDILVIPVSTVSFESIFSTKSRILDSFHSSLSPTIVEALTCVQNWLRSIKQNVNYLQVEINEVEMVESGV